MYALFGVWTCGAMMILAVHYLFNGNQNPSKEGQDFLENGTSSGFVAFVERGEDEFFQQKGKYGRRHFYAVKA